jgi:hypothetical protein
MERTFADLVDRLVKTYIRYISPKSAVAGWLVLNLLISVVVYWVARSDFFTVAGYWVTLSGLLVTLIELYRARTISDQVKEAVEREIRRQRARHYRFCLELAVSSLQQVRAHASVRSWRAAAVKMGDLKDSLSRINAVSAAADDFWHASANAFNPWVVRFDAAKVNQLLVNCDMIDWEELVHSISNRLQEELSVEQPEEEQSDDSD